MIVAQGGVCVICRIAPAEHVDHDHQTGKVRGVLCFSCNAALGQFKDRPDVMRRAAAYVEGNLWNPTLVAQGVYRQPS
ncbi:endonuclease domain-containing protein [Streptomyces sp. NPDC008265]